MDGWMGMGQLKNREGRGIFHFQEGGGFQGLENYLEGHFLRD